MPSRVISTTSFMAVGQLHVDESSPGSIAIAMMPPLRMLPNSASAVFLTVPCCVAKNRKPGCCQVISSLFGPILETTRISAAMFSPDFEFEQVCDAAALGGAAHVGNFVHALDVDPARVREEHQVIVRARREQVLDKVSLFPFHGDVSRVVMPITPLPPRRWAR